jgi:AAA family ATP:ADP antiporter
MLQRALSPIVDVRKEETLTVFLMFAYSFLAMMAYNTIKPITRSTYIRDLGADNLPYVLLAAGFIIGILMAGYAWLMARLPKRWGLPITQVGMSAVLFGFWFLFHTGATWVSVPFYVAGLILGVLLISQFWTLANVVYDPRQAKRLFGFIGAGAPLGGMAGSALAAYAKQIGSVNLILPSAVVMLVCAALVAFIVSRERVEADPVSTVKREKGVSAAEAFNLLRSSRHLQIIALVISFAAVGAAIIEQQLNMAAEAANAAKGAGATDAITAFLAQVALWTSSIGFVIQIWLTAKIHRYLGIGFALMILPVCLGSTGIVMLLNAALWAPGLARVIDQSLRYTVDKTTREILFLPLTGEIKLKAKSFVDVTVDRAAKAIGALLLLVLVKPWGLHLDWQRLSYASLAVTALWVFMALRARKGYLTAFRESIERRDIAPAEMRLNAADLSTVETLVEELAHPEPARVIYAIDVLESLDKRNLVTPLLLYHQSPAVRRRALHALGSVRSDIAAQWLPHIRPMMADPDPGVRAAAIGAIADIGGDDAAMLARPLLKDADPRIRATAAVALAGSPLPDDVNAAEATLVDLLGDTREDARRARRDVATALREIENPRFRHLLIQLLYDPAPDVADEAMESVQIAGASDFIFVPTLVALLRHRRLKGRARAVLASYGEAVIDPLAHFMRDPDEDAWIRRHIPATLAKIPSQKTVDVLVGALAEQDGFLRYKAVTALGRLRRTDNALTFAREPIEALALREARRFFNYLSLHDNLCRVGKVDRDSLLALALTQKMHRSRDRIYGLLALLYPWRDIAAAEWTLRHGDPRSRASASEYLDNILTGQLRKDVMPVIEDLPVEEKVRRGNVIIRTRPRDLEETLLQLINDDDQVVAAAAIDAVRRLKVWALADDLEHVLSHRDVRDWYVFEAVSWALAEQRMTPERRRELWHEPLPAAEIAERLRRLPLFAAISVDELYRIAGATRQAGHDAGASLLQEGAVPDTIHILIDGRLVASGRGGEPQMIDVPAAPGFIEALQGLPMRQAIRTAERSVTLAIATEQLRTLLADNTDLVRGLFATLAEGLDGQSQTVRTTGAAADLVQLATGGLTPVEKVLAVQRVPVFSRIAAEELRHVAQITHTVEMSGGATLFEASAPPALWLILSGEVRLEDPAGGPPLSAHAGDTIGSFSALSGGTIGRSAKVVKDGHALRIDRDDLFDLLGEHPELMRQLFSGIFRSVAEERLYSSTSMRV